MHKVIPAFVPGEINQENADQLIAKTKGVNEGSLRVFFSDQRSQYWDAIPKSFAQWVQPKCKGQRGPLPKPRRVPPPDLLYVQVVKHRRKGRVVKVTTKVVFGTPEALEAYLKESTAGRSVNTAFVERQNNTMHQHNRRFTRKTLGFSNKRYWLERQLHLCGLLSFLPSARWVVGGDRLADSHENEQGTLRSIGQLPRDLLRFSLLG